MDDFEMKLLNYACSSPNFLKACKGLICPRYNSIKSQVTRSRRKQLPPDITTFDEIPNES
ncbi:hypothetical protein U3516DRAFT_736402 [Neocallimastix sp. 'constans']